QREALQALVHTALVTKQPFEILLLGDGEAYVFAHEVGPFGNEDRQMRERHWWNVQLTRSERDALATRLRSAYRSADIVGVPTIHRFVRDFSPRSRTLLGDTSNRGIVTSARGAAELETVPNFSEERLHHRIFD